MTTTSEIAIQYAARGAKQAQRADRQVRNSIKETAQTAREEAGTINRWMQRHQAALAGIGVAATAAMGAIIQNSPALSAELAMVRLGFSLLAMQIGRDLAPAMRKLGDLAMGLAKAYRELPDPIRKVVSGGIGLIGVLGTLASIAGTVSFVLTGQALVPALQSLVSWLGIGSVSVGSLTGALSGAVGTITSSTAAVVGIAAAVGAAIGTFGVWILHITGAIDMVNSLGKAVGSFLGPQLANLGLVMGTVLSGGLLPLITAFGAFINGTLEGGLDEGISRAVESLDIFITAFDDIISAAKRWGTDLIDNFLQGINSKVSEVEGLADNVISRVEDKLGFDLEENDRMARRWGSDLVEEFSAGMQQQSQRLESAAPDPGQATGLQPGTRPTPASGGGGGGGDGGVTVILERGAVQMRGGGSRGSEIDGSDIAEQVGQEFDRRTSGRGRL